MRRGVACGIVFVLSLGIVAAAGGTGAARASTTSTTVPTASTASNRDLVAGQRVTIRYCNNQKARITEPAAFHGTAAKLNCFAIGSFPFHKWSTNAWFTITT